MPFITSAGLAPTKTSHLSADEYSAARVQPAPEMKQMATRHGYDCLLRRVSGSICDNAVRANRIELERMGRRASNASRFQEALAELKERLEWKAAARTNSGCSDAGLVLSSKQANVA
jgi:hypothetical protein